MNIIRNRTILNRAIRTATWEEETQFPVILHFCEGLGEPLFKITVDKVEDDVFVDGKGQKWMRVKE